MNKDLTFLPQNKQDDLQRIVAMIREHCPDIGMIILFGSYARGDWREMKDLAPDRKSGHPSDYDILTITRDEEQCSSQVWQEISNACTETRLSATPRFIHHDINFVNTKLERDHYFFSDIVAEGRLLYDAGLFGLATKREMQPLDRLRIAEEDFAEWFESAVQFEKMHQFCMNEGWLKKAAFNLHQASEASYKTALLVFTGYIPDEHYLAILSDRAANIDLEFQAVFEAENDFEHNAFTALEYAYIGARYDKRYTIDEPTVNYLAKRVEALLQLTETRCVEKIAALRSASDS
ncbi:MAG: HEPN domain-containing protein [Candidatus Thiodiazotropha sp.]